MTETQNHIDLNKIEMYFSPSYESCSQPPIPGDCMASSIQPARRQKRRGHSFLLRCMTWKCHMSLSLMSCRPECSDLATPGGRRAWKVQSLPWDSLPDHVLVVVQSPSHIQLFTTAWTVPCQASLSPIISQSLSKFLSNKSVVPTNISRLCPVR